MSDTVKLIEQLEASRFYGTVELKYEAGKLVLIRKSETFKPTELNYGNNRIAYERNQSR